MQEKQKYVVSQIEIQTVLHQTVGVEILYKQRSISANIMPRPDADCCMEIVASVFAQQLTKYVCMYSL